MSEEDLDDLTDVLFDAADEDNSGSITFEELKAELEKHPGVIENLTIRSDTYTMKIYIFFFGGGGRQKVQFKLLPVSLSLQRYR